MLTIPQLNEIARRDAHVYEALKRIVDAVNNLGKGIGLDPSQPAGPPRAIASLGVRAQDGIFDLAIADPSPVERGIFYFAESDTSPAFPAPTVYFLGSSRNLRVALGNLTLYWRAYSQYPGSNPSSPVTFGSPPTAVVGGGVTGPAPQPSAGSGTSDATHGASGFGRFPARPIPL